VRLAQIPLLAPFRLLAKANYGTVEVPQNCRCGQLATTPTGPATGPRREISW